MLDLLTVCRRGPDHASRQPTELAWQITIDVYTVLRYSL